MSSVDLVWATPDGDKLVAYLARVSNTKAKPDDPSEKLIAYLLKHKHFSPFEMVHACVEINTTRDISHQIIRHASFKFQEFSGRYAAYDDLLHERECRMQDTKNRQNSLSCEDKSIEEWWNETVDVMACESNLLYREALEKGIAKEVARSILPEGLVPTKMYMVGSLRSWIHYIAVRTDESTQKEHREVAEQCAKVIFSQFPQVAKAVIQAGQ